MPLSTPLSLYETLDQTHSDMKQRSDGTTCTAWEKERNSKSDTPCIMQLIGCTYPDAPILPRALPKHPNVVGGKEDAFVGPSARRTMRHLTA